MTLWQRIYIIFWMRSYRLRFFIYETLPQFIAWKVLPARIVLWCYIRVHSGLMEAPKDEYRRAYQMFVQDNNIEGM